MFQQYIAALESALESAFLSGEGIEEAEALYRETFRCGESFTLADRPEDVSYMLWCLEEEEGMDNAQAMAALENGARFFDSCNYKGEGMGFVTEKQGEAMRVFLSRHSYI